MMKRGFIPSGVRIGRTALLVALLGIVFAGGCVADQLQWIPLPVCRNAAKVIARTPLLVSFCSLADEDYIELWQIRDVRTVYTSAPNLFEMVVSAKRLCRSECAFSSADFPIPEEEWLLHEAKAPGWFAVGIDLAYIYVHDTGESFSCLAQVLGLPCTVEVGAIRLPDSVLQEVGIWLRARQHTNLWSPFSDPSIGTQGCHAK